MKRDTLYEFCKDFTTQYEKCEQIATDRIKEYLAEGYREEEIQDLMMRETDELEMIYSSCNVYEAGLKAFIVDDFVKMLDEDLQMKIIRDCMKQKTSMW